MNNRGQHDKKNNACSSDDNNQPSIAPDLKREILAFDIQRLRKQTVYYVCSSTRVKFGPRTHGFIAIGRPGSASKRGHGQVYSLSPLITYSSYIVSKALITAANQSKVIKSETKKALKCLEGQTFLTVEHFMRALLTEKSKFISADPATIQLTIYHDASIPDKDIELRELTTINENINWKTGALLPNHPMMPGCKRDTDIFEGGGINQEHHALPNISATTVRDLFEQQRIFAHYMEEKAGMGKSVKPEDKLSINADRSEQILNGLVFFKRIPDPEDMFTGNCHKASATLLQMAENLSAQQQNRAPTFISGQSLFSIGSEQRMYMWNPLKPSMKSIVLALIDKTDTNGSSMSLNELAGNKGNILHILSTLPLKKEISALLQVLDANTALGKIFYQQRNETLFKPDISRGYLLKAKQRLDSLQKKDNKSASSNCKILL